MDSGITVDERSCSSFIASWSPFSNPKWLKATSSVQGGEVGETPLTYVSLFFFFLFFYFTPQSFPRGDRDNGRRTFGAVLRDEVKSKSSRPLDWGEGYQMPILFLFFFFFFSYL